MPPPVPHRKRIARRVKSAGILPATVMVLLTLFAAAAVLWIGFTRLLRDAWPWQEGGLETTTPTPGFQTTQLVLTLVAGIGGAILVVVAYRRQRDLELARFDERFAAAAAQLGAPTAAERLAGVYAMAALADTWEKHRQQCIDVLCGYLRLPYDPTNTLLKTVANERTWYVNDRAERKETRTYEQLPNDREVRLTIISTITRHLRHPADGGTPVSWQGHDLDFTGATFDGGDFTRTNFSGGLVSFDGAQFTSGMVRFNDTHFADGAVSFNGAQFAGGWVTFNDAEFKGSAVSFRALFAGSAVIFSGTRFTGGTVSFDSATFSGGEVTFRSEFSGGTVSFNEARFLRNGPNFAGAQFAGATVTFDHAQFAEGRVNFVNTRFTGGTVNFNGTQFAGALVAFDSARFSGGKVTFDEARFASGTVTFGRARFASGTVTFNNTRFTGGIHMVTGAELTGGQVTFDRAEFTGGVVTRDGAVFRGWSPPEPDLEPSEDEAG